MNIQEKIKSIIAEKCAVPVETITTETPLSTIAEDSLTRIDFLFEIEQLIGKKIPEDSIFEIETVGDLLHEVNKLV